MNRFRKEAFEWVKSIGLAVIIFAAATTIGDVTQVYGQSMEPTLHQNDQLVFSKMSDAQRGDIVIVKSEIPLTDSELAGMNPIQRWKIGSYKPLIKRVVAIGGDEVRIQDGTVYVNGQALDEAYIGGVATPGEIYIEEIPQGYYFVMGDNRHNSLDSRSERVGLVSDDQIAGKVIVRFFPLSDIGFL